MTKSAHTIEDALAASILAAWNTNCRVTAFLVESLPTPLWRMGIPGSPRRTFRTLAAHIHNARCTWIKTLGQPHGIVPPLPVARHTVQRRQLVAALRRSGEALGRLLRLGLEHHGKIPPSPSYVWRNLPLDVGHVLAYFIAHEGHHRGQIVLAARQMGHPLPPAVTAGLWQWTARTKTTSSAGHED
ncbi:MAG: hypothetical protein QOK37_4588 [Thermoanaerobaculia bacterium]|jgi:uncharacterized damage-inducible protein DinB|nr:hypothetical protein [Thermoanaerobaculia bacterium]